MTRKIMLHRGLLATGVAALLLAAPAHATIFPVTLTADDADGTCDADCTLREAVIAANASGGADVITLSMATYALGIAGDGEDAGATGDLDVTEDLTVTGAGIDATTVDAQALDGVFDVKPGAKLTITDLTVTDAPAARPAIDLAFAAAPTAPRADVARVAFVDNDGGGIRASGFATQTIASSRFVDNGTAASPFGGGGVINQNNATATITNSLFRNNRANFGGGALFNQNDATASVTDSTFTENKVAGFAGGAIFNQNQAVLTMLRVTIADNRAEAGSFAGGAVFNQNDARLTITDGLIRGNRADSTNGGGAFFVQNNSKTHLERTTVSENRAFVTAAGSDRGGGAFFAQNNAEVTTLNVTFDRNESDRDGGAFVFRNAAKLTLRATTVSDNVAASGGGAIHNATSPVTAGDVHFVLAGTILAGNRVGATPTACATNGAGVGLLRSDGGNLESANTCGLTGPGDKTNADAKLAALAGNGGLTPTRALPGDSAALDMVPPALCPAIDQRGVARPQGGGCDAGAFERQPPAATTTGTPTTSTTTPPATIAAPPVVARPPAARPPVQPQLKAAQVFTLPSARRCVSRRKFTIRLRAPAGAKLASATVKVNGKRAAVFRGARLRSTVDLRGLPKGRFTVDIEVTTVDGRRVRGKRSYRTCTPKRAGRRG